MNAPLNPVTRLADYQPPAWHVRRVELQFDLDAEQTRVTSTLSLEPDPSLPVQPLRLDGEDLELLEVALNGQILAPEHYRQDGAGLCVDGIDGPCQLRTTVHIRPCDNTRLEGLYLSRNALFTQCEAEGFRRITFFLDRPDISAVFDVTLRADKARYPVLLSNGDRVEAGELPDGRHFVRWRDPHPKPCYLFALAAGALERVSAPFTTMQGRAVEVNVWAEAADVARCRYALGAALRAMAWDERRFGRAYDLSVFNIVAAQDFTMGAMENKGLNIFNARYILADRQTATDEDFQAIEAVIGHEYFHNWSGNRVTLRDWFQLSLKEGLTVFRDQEFTADLHSRGLKRIDDVRLLKSRQFVEDAGPLAHPVRPGSYREINNFYTATVYEKGAELIRMLHTLLGEEAFRQGLDRYFTLHDGGAATVEDLVGAMAHVSGRDLSQFLQWWSQAGTPRIEVRESHDPEHGDYVLEFHQRDVDQPLHIPLALAFYDASGQRLTQQPETDACQRPGLIELRQRHHTLRLHGLEHKPLPAFLQGLSAPVRLDFHYPAQDLARLVRMEPDPLTRWEAMQHLFRRALLEAEDAPRNEAAAALAQARYELLEDPEAEPAFVAECLTPPDFWELSAALEQIDLDALWAAREALLDACAAREAESLRRHYAALATQAQGGLDGASAGARRMRNLCLHALARIEHDGSRALNQFRQAQTLTERLAALAALIQRGLPHGEAALHAFATRYRDDPLMTDKWLSLVVTTPRPDSLQTVAAILSGPHWQPTNPNRVRAVLGSFIRNNVPAFHRADGAGYALLLEYLPHLDALNPQVAARHLGLLENWRRLDQGRRARLADLLQALASRLNSRDSREILARLRESQITSTPPE